MYWLRIYKIGILMTKKENLETLLTYRTLLTSTDGSVESFWQSGKILLKHNCDIMLTICQLNYVLKKKKII